MGRSTPSNATPLHQEIHQNPAAGPVADEDLYEPPADYQRPPPHAKPPKDFPPAYDFVKPPSPTTATAFSPPQQQTATQFPPVQEQTATQFPPVQEQTVTEFPPVQEQTATEFPPTQPQPNPIFRPQIDTPQPVIHVGFMRPPVTTQPNLLQMNQPWETHLFDCMANPQNALITLCFPCVTFGQIAEILDNGGTTCASSGLLYSCVAFCLGVPCLMSCGYRSKLRARFGLVESPAPDCLIHCFCECCALCQEYRELEKRGYDPSIGHAGNVARLRQQQLQQLGMMPPMQQRMMI